MTLTLTTVLAVGMSGVGLGAGVRAEVPTHLVVRCMVLPCEDCWEWLRFRRGRWSSFMLTPCSSNASQYQQDETSAGLLLPALPLGVKV